MLLLVVGVIQNKYKYKNKTVADSTPSAHMHTTKTKLYR